MPSAISWTCLQVRLWHDLPIKTISRLQTRSARSFDNMAHTFINAGKRSRCVKYETRLVWYAPEVNDNAAWIAFWRRPTRKYQHSDHVVQSSRIPDKIFLCEWYFQLHLQNLRRQHRLHPALRAQQWCRRWDSYIFLSIWHLEWLSKSEPVSVQRRKVNELWLTSRAFSSLGATALLIWQTARANSCWVSFYTMVNSYIDIFMPVETTWKWRRSSAVTSSNRRCRLNLSGFRRKNSSQKPSEWTVSFSSSFCEC